MSSPFLALLLAMIWAVPGASASRGHSLSADLWGKRRRQSSPGADKLFWPHLLQEDLYDQPHLGSYSCEVQKGRGGAVPQCFLPTWSLT